MTIPRHLSLVPICEIQRAVTLTFADLNKKKSRGSTPYANAFCRHYFGKSRPSKVHLQTLVGSYGDTVPELLRKLDSFLRSNGESRFMVSEYFAYKAFPSLSIKLEVRLDNHYAMLNQRDNNVKLKHLAEQKKHVSKMKQAIEMLSKKELSAWVSENQDSMVNHELVSCLQHWYLKNYSDDYSFYDLYSGYTAPQIALDLSWEH